MSKKLLIKEVAAHMELPEELVEDIIAFQGEDAAKATHIHNQIELSGFGKFLFSAPKASRKIVNMEKKMQENRVKEQDLPRFVSYLEILKRKRDEVVGAIKTSPKRDAESQ